MCRVFSCLAFLSVETVGAVPWVCISGASDELPQKSADREVLTQLGQTKHTARTLSPTTLHILPDCGYIVPALPPTVRRHCT